MSYDRDLTKRLVAAATGWREAARAILAVEIEGMLLWPPFYASLFYCLEQSLKGFLASRGFSRAQLREIGHKLADLTRTAKSEGLSIESSRFEEFISQLDGKLLELRYLEGEDLEIAEPKEALELVDAFFQMFAQSIPLEELLGSSEK